MTEPLVTLGFACPQELVDWMDACTERPNRTRSVILREALFDHLSQKYPEHKPAEVEASAL